MIRRDWKFIIFASVLVLILLGCGFVGDKPMISTLGSGGFLLGFWHGLLAPWTLLIRFFMDVQMYQCPSAGWSYDFGFLLGVMLSLPIGWITALIAVIYHLALAYHWVS